MRVGMETLEGISSVRVPEESHTATVHVEKLPLKHPYISSRGFLLRGVLTAAECAYYCEQADLLGYEDLKAVGYRPEYRNNERLIFDSKELANVLFQRISLFLPEEIEVTKKNEMNLTCGLGTSGVWRPAYMNSVFRLCKYNPGGHFAPHCDGNFVADTEERSFYTFMIYLNGSENFEGGATRFLTEQQQRHRDDGLGIYCAIPGSVIDTVVPEAGLALVFLHNTWHDGEQVRDGCKFILRSDVMFRRVPGSGDNPRSSNDLVAQRLYQRFIDMEDKDPQLAAELLRKAFKLSPQLEADLNSLAQHHSDTA